jgi:hypothetical protein
MSVDRFAITTSDFRERSVSWSPNENGTAKEKYAAKDETNC